MNIKAFDSLPPSPLPLRGALPRLKLETRERLCAWGLRQPAVRSWVMLRASAYFDAGFGRDFDPLLLDATACLDLLRWRCNAEDDRTSLGQMTALEEVGNLPVPKS